MRNLCRVVVGLLALTSAGLALAHAASGAVDALQFVRVGHNGYWIPTTWVATSTTVRDGSKTAKAQQAAASDLPLRGRGFRQYRGGAESPWRAGRAQHRSLPTTWTCAERHP